MPLKRVWIDPTSINPRNRVNFSHRIGMVEGFQDDFGTVSSCHPEGSCRGPHCTIHKPTDHHMREWKILWRPDVGIFERICEHGIGHPDPDCPGGPEYRHGCDGCCRP